MPIDSDNNGAEIMVAVRRPVKYAGFVNDACEKASMTVSSLSLVRYRLNDYSVPADTARDGPVDGRKKSFSP